MTATLEQIGTTGSPDGPGRAGAPSVREPWAVGLPPAAVTTAGRRRTDMPARGLEAGARAGSPAAGQDVAGAHPALARIPPRRDGLERLHAPARPRVESRRARRDGAQPGAPPRGVRPRRRGRAPPGRSWVPPGLRPRPLRGLRGASRPGLHARRARRLGRRERGRRPGPAPGRPRLHESRAARRARRRGHRGAVRRQGARLGARVLDERQPGARALGPRVARGGRGDIRRLGAHPHGAGGGLRDGGAGARGAAGRRRRAVDAGGTRRRARRARA